MSINSSLVKLANKIDTNGASNVSPDYKNPNNSVEKSLERIADNYEASGGGGGSSELPSVTPADAGKVLTVDDNGDWVAGEGGGGTGGGVLNLHMDRQTRALDKTWAEIDSVFGNTVVFMDSTALLIGTEEDVAGYFIYFADFYDAPDVAKITFKADTADGYPVAQIG